MPVTRSACQPSATARSFQSSKSASARGFVGSARVRALAACRAARYACAWSNPTACKKASSDEFPWPACSGNRRVVKISGKNGESGTATHPVFLVLQQVARPLSLFSSLMRRREPEQEQTSQRRHPEQQVVSKPTGAPAGGERCLRVVYRYSRSPPSLQRYSLHFQQLARPRFLALAERLLRCSFLLSSERGHSKQPQLHVRT